MRKIDEKVEQIVTLAALYKHLRDKLVVVHFLRIMNEECPKMTFAPGVQTTNIFTSCCARLRLYQHLDHVERNALILTQIQLCTRGGLISHGSL